MVQPLVAFRSIAMATAVLHSVTYPGLPTEPTSFHRGPSPTIALDPHEPLSFPVCLDMLDHLELAEPLSDARGDYRRAFKRLSWYRTHISFSVSDQCLPTLPVNSRRRASVAERSIGGGSARARSPAATSTRS